MHIDNLHIIVCNIMNLYLLHFVLPSLSPVYVIDYAKCPSTGTENGERNSLFSVLHGLKIAFSRPWFPSLGTGNNINVLFRCWDRSASWLNVKVFLLLYLLFNAIGCCCHCCYDKFPANTKRTKKSGSSSFKTCQRCPSQVPVASVLAAQQN